MILNVQLTLEDLKTETLEKLVAEKIVEQMDSETIDKLIEESVKSRIKCIAHDYLQSSEYRAPILAKVKKLIGIE